MFGTSLRREGLGAGNYIFQVEDENDCSGSVAFTIVAAPCMFFLILIFINLSFFIRCGTWRSSE